MNRIFKLRSAALANVSKDVRLLTEHLLCSEHIIILFIEESQMTKSYNLERGKGHIKFHRYVAIPSIQWAEFNNKTIRDNLRIGILLTRNCTFKRSTSPLRQTKRLSPNFHKPDDLL